MVGGTASAHEAVQETLAAYALGSVEDEQLVDAEDLLSTHLPGCADCRAAFEAFQVVAGELGLAAQPRVPPRVLAARLHKQIRGATEPRWVPGLAGAAVVVMIAGLFAWSLHLTGRVNRAEQRQSRTTEVLAAVSHPESRTVSLASPENGPSSDIQLAATFVPGRAAIYLFGLMPTPTANRVYQLWLVREGRFASAGTFVPDRGHVLLRVGVDPSGYDGLLITEEPRQGSDTPSARRLVTASF